MENLEERIQKIEERNARVEADKAWEVSFTRRIILVVLTYVVVGITFMVIDVVKPWMNAIIPASAFMISTFTISFVKTRWLRKR